MSIFFFLPTLSLVWSWGGCWSLSQLHRRRWLTPLEFSAHLSIWGFGTLLSGTSAVLWRCPIISSNFCPKPRLEPRTFCFSAQSPSLGYHRTLEHSILHWFGLCGLKIAPSWICSDGHIVVLKCFYIDLSKLLWSSLTSLGVDTLLNTWYIQFKIFTEEKLFFCNSTYI